MFRPIVASCMVVAIAGGSGWLGYSVGYHEQKAASDARILAAELKLSSVQTYSSLLELQSLGTQAVAIMQAAATAMKKDAP